MSNKQAIFILAVQRRGHDAKFCFVGTHCSQNPGEAICNDSALPRTGAQPPGHACTGRYKCMHVLLGVVPCLCGRCYSEFLLLPDLQTTSAFNIHHTRNLFACFDERYLT